MAEKWGEAVAGRGFAQIPNYLLSLNQFLDEDAKLTPIELLALLQLVGVWWKKDDLPFPSMRTLAQRVGASERQLHRAMTRLEKLGFLRRAKRKNRGIIASNAYDMTPLVEQLNVVARAFPNQFPRTIKARNTPVRQTEAESQVSATSMAKRPRRRIRGLSKPPSNEGQ